MTETLYVGGATGYDQMFARGRRHSLPRSSMKPGLPQVKVY